MCPPGLQGREEGQDSGSVLSRRPPSPGEPSDKPSGEPCGGEPNGGEPSGGEPTVVVVAALHATVILASLEDVTSQSVVTVAVGSNLDCVVLT